MLTDLSRIRPFLGARDFERSRSFYRELGFRESVISEQMCVFNTDSVWFYLQDYYVKDWVDNTMIFLEVADVDVLHSSVIDSGIVDRYDGVKVTDIKDNDWGREFFLHDPSGNLWHIGRFAD